MVFLIRKLYGRIALKVYVLAALVWLQTYAISFRNVLENTPTLTDIGAVARFYAYAFLHTQAMVQITIVAALALALWLFRDLFKTERTFI